VFNLVVRANPVLAPRHVYQAKATRWRQQWPSLTVLPWPAHTDGTGDLMRRFPGRCQEVLGPGRKTRTCRRAGATVRPAGSQRWPPG
jgi:hypothetical protein